MIDVAKRLVSANVSRFTPTRSWRLVADKRVPRNRFLLSISTADRSIPISYYGFTIEDLVDRIQSKSKFYSSPF